MLASVNVGLVFILVTERVSKGFAGRQEDRGKEGAPTQSTLSRSYLPLSLRNTRSLTSEAGILGLSSPLALSDFYPHWTCGRSYPLTAVGRTLPREINEDGPLPTTSRAI